MKFKFTQRELIHLLTAIWTFEIYNTKGPLHSVRRIIATMPLKHDAWKMIKDLSKHRYHQSDKHRSNKLSDLDPKYVFFNLPHDKI